MCRRSIFVVPKIQRPHPSRTYRRRVHLQDAADYDSIGEHIVIIIVPRRETGELLRNSGCAAVLPDLNVPPARVHRERNAP
jgi:hypothetical protein